MAAAAGIETRGTGGGAGAGGGSDDLRLSMRPACRAAGGGAIDGLGRRRGRGRRRWRNRLRHWRRRFEPAHYVAIA